jgi:hypothetical protein
MPIFVNSVQFNIIEKIMKRHNYMRFPKEVYIDRYMLENKDKFLQLKKEC